MMPHLQNGKRPIEYSTIAVSIMIPAQSGRYRVMESWAFTTNSLYRTKRDSAFESAIEKLHEHRLETGLILQLAFPNDQSLPTQLRQEFEALLIPLPISLQLGDPVLQARF